MSPITNLLMQMLRNRHTSIAALIYAMAKFGCPILKAWFPARTEAIDVTANGLEGLAVFYGFAAAGDASRGASRQEIAQAIDSGDTSVLQKPAAKP